MRNFLAALVLALTVPAFSPAHAADQPAANIKEWSFLVFLNGNNNLDSYGEMNMNQMEKVGSTKDVNILVQWASLENGGTKRILVQKDEDPSKVTSPVVQDMGKVDMGDWRNLVEFVRWAHANYPAKHYFVSVWNHGSGWHRIHANGASGVIEPMDISFDDNTGNSITTEQLGVAMSESAKVLGHKVEIYGSDACLMAMAEVANEMSDSVDYFVGSEEVEPAQGWPYDDFLKRWVAKPQATGKEISKMLTEEYVRAYNGGQYGKREVTFSAFDLNQMANLNSKMAALSSRLAKLDAPSRTKVMGAVNKTLTFTYADYGDLGDFLRLLAPVVNIDRDIINGVNKAIEQFVVANLGTTDFDRASGVALWLPSSKWTFDRHGQRYSGLKFHSATQWGDTLRFLVQDATSDDNHR